MNRSSPPSIRALLLVAGMGLAHAAQADFEVTGPDGRRILLKDDGTWRYVEATGKDQSDPTAKEAADVLLLLERKVERGNNCRFVIQLVNNLPYEIRNLVPYFSAYRANGIIHETASSPSAFTNLKPGDKQNRQVDFLGIACDQIARVQVVGGDRCEMGDLNKFNAGSGECLARVRVVASELVRFDK